MEKVQGAPGLVVAQAHMEKDASKEKKRQIAGWFTKVLEVVASEQEYVNAEEMFQCDTSARRVWMLCGRSYAAK